MNIKVEENHVEKLGTSILIINHDFNYDFLSKFFNIGGVSDREDPKHIQFRENWHIHIYYSRVCGSISDLDYDVNDPEHWNVISCPLIRFLKMCKRKHLVKKVFIHVPDNLPFVRNRVEKILTCIDPEVKQECAEFRLIVDNHIHFSVYFKSRYLTYFEVLGDTDWHFNSDFRILGYFGDVIELRTTRYAYVANKSWKGKFKSHIDAIADTPYPFLTSVDKVFY